MLLSTYFAPFYTPVLRHKGSTFSTSLPTLVIFLFLFRVFIFNNYHPGGYGVVSPYSSDGLSVARCVCCMCV